MIYASLRPEKIRKIITASLINPGLTFPSSDAPILEPINIPRNDGMAINGKTALFLRYTQIAEETLTEIIRLLVPAAILKGHLQAGSEQELLPSLPPDQTYLQ